MIIYEVQPGDSLYRIAQKNQVPVQYLVELNQLQQQTRLTPGQTIVIPEIALKHEVQRGETLAGIAEQYGTSVMALWQINPKLGGTDMIFPGQVLAIEYQNPSQGAIAVNGYVYPYIDAPTLRALLPYLTYVSVFSYQFDLSGKLNPQNAQAIINLAKEFHVKPIMVLTAMDEEGRFSSDAVREILTANAIRYTLFESVLQALRSSGFEGVDIDFEYIYPEDRDLFTEFVQQLREFLAPFGYTVFVSVAPKTSPYQTGLLYEAYDYEALGVAADRTLIMTYDWGYAWSEPMAIAPIPQVERVLEYATTVIAPEKILMGVPNYGYDWPLPHIPGQTSGTSIGNKAARELAIDVGAPIMYDEVAQAPHFNYWKERSEREVWFEDARSIAAKLQLVSQYQLGGISIWNLMRPFPQLWLVLAETFDIIKEI